MFLKEEKFFLLLDILCMFLFEIKFMSCLKDIIFKLDFLKFLSYD